MASERYVALGDSYTIGEGVAPEERWPNVLTLQLREQGFAIDLVANPSVTGWTSAQLIEHELPVLESSNPTFVTVLIGVNDWVQGVPLDDFQHRFGTILDGVSAGLPDRRKILLVTIPDFSVTPEGTKYSRGRDISAGLAQFNTVLMHEGASRGLPVVDIFPLSRELGTPEFVSDDGLHPNGAAYARWTELIFPAACQLLKDGAATP